MTMTIVGLPDDAVLEARERVKAAIRRSLGCTFPMKRVVVNLTPADLKKAGPAYDLPIAVGILLSSEQVCADVFQIVVLGELSLDGGLCHNDGLLPMVALARQEGFVTIIVPEADARETSLVEGTNIVPITSLAQLVSNFRGEITAPEYSQPDEAQEDALLPAFSITDLTYLKGQEHVKRALEVAAAGGHNVVMMGPPGSGKTLLARSLSSILPPMTTDEALKVTKIYQVNGLLPSDTPLIRQRPFLSPHCSISNAGLVDGGHWPKPEHFQGTKLACNAEMTPTEVREFCRVEEPAQGLLKAAMKQFYLSAHAFHRILKLARAIANLENDDIIKTHHLAESIQYRPRVLV